MLISRLSREQVFWWTKKLKPFFGVDKNSHGKGRSNEKVEVIIPCLDKDLVTLPIAVESLRKFLNHPLGNIYIVSPIQSRKVKKFCRENKCVFVDEKRVAPLAIEQIKYTPKGDDRAGWIYQQLIKLSADKLAETDCFLVWDADTVLVKPQAYFRNGKFILNHSDEYHHPYFVIYQKLTGEKALSPVSFIAHQMLLSKTLLNDLRATIELHTGKIWWESILSSLDNHEPSSFSEYELYGNYLFAHHPERIIIEYWFNKILPRSNVMTLAETCQKFAKDFKTVSWHSYN